MIQNDYYHIAMNDFEYLNAVKDLLGVVICIQLFIFVFPS